MASECSREGCRNNLLQRGRTPCLELGSAEGDRFTLWNTTAPFRTSKIPLIHCRVLAVTMAVRQDPLGPLSPRVSVIARLLIFWLRYLRPRGWQILSSDDLSAWQGPVAGSGGTGQCLRFCGSKRCSKLTFGLFGQKCCTCEDLKLNLRPELSIADIAAKA